MERRPTLGLWNTGLQMRVTLKCTSPHWRDDLRTLLRAGNEVQLSHFSHQADAPACKELARSYHLHLSLDPINGTATFTRAEREVA